MSYHTKDDVIKLLNSEICLLTGIPHHEIGPTTNFIQFGISSIQTITILNKVKKKLGVDINLFAMFEYKNIDQLSDYLATFLEQ